MRPRSKRLGQCFLSDHRVLNREVGYVQPEGKIVLEIGAGDGRLTRLLAAKARELVAVEIDRNLIPELLNLPDKFSNLEIIHADFLDLDFEGKRFDVIASNVPYSISSLILFKLATMQFDRAVLCLQEEFVDRMLARPGDKKRSRLSVMSQLHFEIELLESVSRKAFKPSPNVDSAIIELRRKPFTATPFQSNFINALFQHKKKRVRNSLIDSAAMFNSTKVCVKAAAEKLTHKAERAFGLTNDELLQTAKELESALS